MQQPTIAELEQQLAQLHQQLQQMQTQLQQTQQQLQQLKSGTVPTTQPAVKVKQPAPAAQGSDLENFIGLKFIHLAGIVVLVIGLSIGVKYAIDQNLISAALRIALAYFAGAVLFVLSLYLRKNYNGFSAILFSGGMVSLYFTTYAACVYYNLVPGWLAFVLMAACTLYTTFSALRYNRQEIAVLGIVGTYGIPFLVGKNQDAVLAFFAYILLTNLGVLYLSFKRSWKTMNQLSLVVTWLLFFSWYAVRYQPRDFAVGLLFLILFYLLFQAGALAFGPRRRVALPFSELLAILVNNTALYGGMLLLLNTTGAHYPAITTAVFCGLFFVQGYILQKLLHTEYLLVRLIFLQSLLLLLVFTGIEWAGFVLSLTWICIACALFITGVLVRKAWPRLTAVALCGITLLKLLVVDSTRFSAVEKVISYLVIGTVLLLVSFYYQKFRSSLFADAKEEDTAP